MRLSGPPSPKRTHAKSPSNSSNWIAERAFSASPSASSTESLALSDTASRARRERAGRSQIPSLREPPLYSASNLRFSHDLSNITASAGGRPSSPEVNSSTQASSRVSVADVQSIRQDSGAILHASSTKLSEFRREDKRFHWTRDKPLETHKDFPPSNAFPLHWLGHIGKSEGALVYACDTEAKPHGFKDTVAVKIIDIDKRNKDQRKTAEGECNNLKALSHHHIIAYLGSFTHLKYFGIVMFPVAEFQLGQFLETVSEDNKNQTGGSFGASHAYAGLLRSYFGCLCRALMHLHHRPDPIKHKDIKPANILVDRYRNVILTDFGISKHYENKNEARTTGDTQHTVMYAPPEVFSRKRRGLDQDIFSLGCVFLEMATVILGRTLDDLYKYIESDVHTAGLAGPDQKSERIVCYSLNPEKVSHWVENLRTRCNEFEDAPKRHTIGTMNEATLEAIQKMMSSKPSERPDLAELWLCFKDLSCTSCQEEAAASNVPHIEITPTPVENLDEAASHPSRLQMLEDVKEEVPGWTPPPPTPVLQSHIVERMTAIDLTGMKLNNSDSRSSQASETEASTGVAQSTDEVQALSSEEASTSQLAAGLVATTATIGPEANASNDHTSDLIRVEGSLTSGLEEASESHIPNDDEADENRAAKRLAEHSEAGISSKGPDYQRTPVVTFAEPQPETEGPITVGSASAETSETARDTDDYISNDPSENEPDGADVDLVSGNTTGVNPSIPAHSASGGLGHSKTKTYTITVVDWQRRTIREYNHYRHVPGKMVVVFNEGNKLLEALPKDQIDCELRHERLKRS